MGYNKMGLAYTIIGGFFHFLFLFSFCLTGFWCIIDVNSYAKFLNNKTKPVSPVNGSDIMMVTEFRHIGFFYVVAIILALLAFAQKLCGAFKSWDGLWLDYVKLAGYLVGVVVLSRTYSIILSPKSFGEQAAAYIPE